MKHLKTISQAPALAGDIPTSAKLAFISDVLDALIVLFQAKEMAGEP